MASLRVFLAMWEGDWEQVKKLIATTSWTPAYLERKHRLFDKKEDTMLIKAARLGREDIVHLLLHAGADIQARNEGGATALIIAAQGGHLPVLHLLLDRGADIEAQANVGWTPLIAAAVKGHYNAIEVLLDRGANINTRDKARKTALMWAATWAHLEVVKVLCRRRADLDIKIGGYMDVLFFAGNGSSGFNLEVVEFLKTWIQQEAEWRRVKNFVVFLQSGGISAADWNVRGLGRVGSMPATDGPAAAAPAAAAPAAAVPDIASSGVTLMSAIQKSKVLENRDLCRIVVAYIPKQL